MRKHEYIHITEATHVYNKTRQTFYNYINKGQIASKKIHNKVYLKISDIEKLLSDYLHIQDEPISNGEVIAPNSKETHYEYDQLTEKEDNEENSIFQFQKSLQKDLLRLHKQYYTLKDDILQKMKYNKQDILFDTKAISSNQEQRIISRLQQQYKEIHYQKKQINKKISLLSLKNKKIGFWLGYVTIVLLQFMIANYIL